MTLTLPRKDLHYSVLMPGFIRQLFKCASANMHAQLCPAVNLRFPQETNFNVLLFNMCKLVNFV